MYLWMLAIFIAGTSHWFLMWSFKRPCQGMWLLYLHSIVKIPPFSPVFPLEEKAFCWLFLWSFKKKHQPFSLAQPFKKALSWHWISKSRIV